MLEASEPRRSGTIGVMDPSLLPEPEDLRRRLEALVAVEDLLGPSRDGFRYYDVDPPDQWRFDSGSGDFYVLAVSAGAALLIVFDHESPRSPWGRVDEAPEWPGMFDGLPGHLRRYLPEREAGEPLSVSACFWFLDGSWHEGNPEPVPRDGDFYDDDPGGAADLLAPLLDPLAEVRELVMAVYEQPDRLEEARALMRAKGVV